MLKREQTEFAAQLIGEGASTLGIDLSVKQQESFLSYLSLLLFWNSRLNLTSIRDPELIVRRHFLDSIAIIRFLSPVGRLLDLGSGAGFPGLPLKIVLPQKEVVLLEARRKKANFLREVVRKLNLKGVEVIEGRAEEMNAEDIGPFDEVVTRAFGSVDIFLQISFPLLRSKGRSLMMHGPEGERLLEQTRNTGRKLGFSESQIERFSLPLGNEERTLLIFVKT